MARFLALDLAADRMHIVVGAPGKVEQALTWTLPEPLTPASGESLGKKLRDFLKGAGVSVAPVLAAVDRERLVVKDVRFPPVARHEEPAVVRFQATKDLVEAAGEVVVDYAVVGSGPTGEKLAVAWIIKREILHATAALCLGLGVRLQALLPRPLAAAAAWQRLQPTSGSAVSAILSGGGQRAELDFVRAGLPLFSRSLPMTPGLAGEIRRSLGIFSSQNLVNEEDLPRELLVAGSPEQPPWRDVLAAGTGLTTRGVDPFLAQDKAPPADLRGEFLPAVGLLQARSGWELAVNFVKPKEPRAADDQGKSRKVFVGIGAAVLALIAIVFVSSLLNARKGTIAELQSAKTDLEEKIKGYAKEKLDIEALNLWENTTISLLDELYDLAARFPHQEGVRVKHLGVEPIVSKGKDKYVARITLDGIVPSDKYQLVHEFVASINKDPHLKATIDHFKGGDATQDFKLKIDVARQEGKKFTTALVVPPPRRAKMPVPEVDPESLLQPDGDGGQP